MHTVTVGITVYNRKKILERSVDSLLNSALKQRNCRCNIRVYDDCSDEYAESDVRAMFPVDIDYYRHDTNHGADFNMGFMYRSFLESGDDILFNADSDLIYSRDWLEAILLYLPKTDGILSLFNSPSHEWIKEEDGLCIKGTVGNAGTVMTRSAVNTICKNIRVDETENSLDWNWCGLFSKLGKKIYCTSKSYVQHIGYNGFNSLSGRMDIGAGFQVDSIINGQILGDVLYDITTQYNKRCNDIRSFYYLFPFDKVPNGKKVVLYGNGVVGKDYAIQLESSRYCNELIRVDRNYHNQPNVFSPDILKDIDCDYVVIAVNFINVREEIKKDILKINPQLNNKIIDVACRIIRV